MSGSNQRKGFVYREKALGWDFWKMIIDIDLFNKKCLSDVFK